MGPRDLERDKEDGLLPLPCVLLPRLELRLLLVVLVLSPLINELDDRPNELLELLAVVVVVLVVFLLLPPSTS